MNFSIHVNLNTKSADELVSLQEREVLTEGSAEDHSDSLGESRHWDSGVGSSSERTSTSHFSVSDGIRIYEEEISRRQLRSSVSVDSLLVESPPPLTSRRSAAKLKKVTIAENDLNPRRDVSRQHETLHQATETNLEEDLYSGAIPRLPSVKDLAALFQPRNASPEPKPRKSLMKVSIMF